jgi:SAM-dependent methyltransferase
MNFNAKETLEKFLEYDFETVIDIGSGDNSHAQIMRNNKRMVTAVNLFSPADIIDDYMNIKFDPFDAVWCCHCLEHQRNTGLFLDKIFSDLKDGGILAITVPPHKETLVGGHLSLWTPGLLIYNLIIAGFDCSMARVKQYKYNISVILKKRKIDLPPLSMCKGNLEILAKYFPVKAFQNMPAIFECNW